MNTSPFEEEFQGPGGNGSENVSRSGRVRKKNSLLAAYESSDPVEKPKKKPEKRQKSPKESTPKGTLKFGGDSVPGKRKFAKEPGNKRMKITGNHNPKLKAKVGNKQKIMGPLIHGDGDLEMDLPPEYELDMPGLGAEEIVDYNSSDVDDRTDGHNSRESHASFNKLKSQAQSTYMMEKSFEKNRKSTGPGGTIAGGGKSKAARKDKGTPRITGYTLWAKEQREIFSKKYPHMDSSSLSKKLSELWATVPPNQKKMWKNKAAKIMRKNANVMENIKNSGPVVSAGKGKKPRGRPRVHPLALEGEDSNGMNNGQTMSGLPPVRYIHKSAGNFLAPREKKVSPAAQPKTWQSQPPKAGRSKPGSSNGTVGLPNKSKQLKTQPAAGDSRSLPRSSLFSTSPSTSFSLSTSKYVSPRKDDEASLYKVTGTAPIDVAAHFALLGESLSIIGERLKDVEGQTVSGSLSVLLDSLLCATGPLLCLSQQVPEFNCIPQERLAHLLDNIAYVMPGL